MTSPDISVVLPVFNAEPYLDRTLDSLCAQTFANFEVIAINDGSSDRSLDILRRRAKVDSRMRIVDQTNCGLVETLNRGVTMASCELIARADADDLYHPRRLEYQIKHMRDSPETVLLGARTVKIDRKDRVLFREYQPEGGAAILEQLAGGFGGVIPHPVAMLRRVAVVEAGMYRPEARHCEDLDLWLRLSNVGKLANLPQHLLYYRVHPASICAVHWKEQREIAKKIVHAWASANGRVVPPVTLWNRAEPRKGRMFRQWANRAASQELYSSAFRSAIMGAIHEPFHPDTWTTFARCMYQTAKETAAKARRGNSL